MGLKNRLKNTFSVSRPEFFNWQKQKDKNRLAKLFSARKIQHITDNYKGQLQELFAVNNPKLYFSKNFYSEFENYFLKLSKSSPEIEQGIWVYFPWNSSLIHILKDVDFQKVRTARNKNLINSEEQKKFYNSTVGVAGLSVGNSVALAIVLQGGAKNIKLADHDKLELSNTNRIRGSIVNLGLSKVEITARQIYEINPYANIQIFPEGLTEKNIDKFFISSPKIDVMVDEIDNLAIKYLIREKAKKYRVPVVMAADNGDNAVVDIERYDLNPKTKFFHGRMGKVSYNGLKNLDKFGVGKLITKHVGLKNVTVNMQKSLAEMGKTITSWPQLGGAALVNGSAVAYSVKKILHKQRLETNRAIISLDEKLDPSYFSKQSVNKRKQSAAVFKKLFNL